MTAVKVKQEEKQLQKLAVAIQRLERSALNSAFQSPTGHLVGAVAAFALLNTIAIHVAALAALGFLWAAWRRAARNGANAAYIRQTGEFAHCLAERELVQLIKLVGKDEVLEQVLAALDARQHLSPAAEEFLAACGERLEPATFTDLVKTQEAVTTVDAQVVDESKVELNLLEDEPPPPQSQGQEQDIGSVNLIECIALDPKSLFVSAPTRVGKGALVAGSIRCVQRLVSSGKHPTIKTVRIWAITPKQCPGELWYWQTVDKFFNPNLEDGDRLTVARQIYEFISEYGRLPRDRENPTILAFDEFSRAAGLLKGIKMADVDPELFSGDRQTFDVWLVDKVLLSASMLQSTGYYVWIITPANTVGGRGFSKGDADSFNVVTLASPENLSFADGGSAAFAAPAIASDHPVFKLGYSAGYRKRDRKWYFIPNYGETINRRTDVDPPAVLNNYWREPSQSTQPDHPPLDDEKSQPLMVSEFLAQAQVNTDIPPELEDMRKEYLNIHPECRTLSDVIDRLGTKLLRRNLIQSRKADEVKDWLISNSLPLPGEAQ